MVLRVNTGINKFGDFFLIKIFAILHILLTRGLNKSTEVSNPTFGALQLQFSLKDEVKPKNMVEM
jgi:hypothetical protein